MKTLRRIKDIFVHHLPLLAQVELKRRMPTALESWEIKPDAAWLNPTDNCNMRCIMCNQWRITKTDELTFDEWKNVIDQLADEGIKKVGFNGGEPLLRKDLADIFQHVTDRGMAPALITSGFLLDEKKLESFLAAGLKHITMSIDGTGEEYEKIRGREWERVEKAAELLGKAYKAGRVDANIGFVIMKQTLTHLPGVKALCERVGLPLTFSLVDSTPFFFKLPENQRTAADSNWVGPEDEAKLKEIQRQLVEMKSNDKGSVIGTWANIDYMTSYFKDPLRKDIPCTVSQVRIMINSHGEVHGGCWSMGSWGCLRKQSLKEILNSEKYKKVHKAMFQKKCPGCSCGYGTNVRYSLPLTIKDQMFNWLPGRRKKIYQK